MKQRRYEPSAFLAKLARTCVWCNEDTTGEDIHQCELMPRAPKRRLLRWTDKRIFTVLWSSAILAIMLMVGLTLVAVQEGKKDKRIYMMEQTINRLTHEVDNCRINRFLPKS